MSSPPKGLPFPEPPSPRRRAPSLTHTYSGPGCFLLHLGPQHCIHRACSATGVQRLGSERRIEEYRMGRVDPLLKEQPTGKHSRHSAFGKI